MKNLNKNAGLITGGFVIGALIGASVGVLFAPHKGKKTRKLIATAVKKTVENFAPITVEKVEDIEHEVIGNMENIGPGFENFLEGKMVNNAVSFKDKMNQRPNLPIDHKMMRR